MTNVVVQPKKTVTVRVKVNANTGQLITSDPVTVQGLPSSGGATRIEQLTDVDASHETSGSVLVYDATAGKYVATANIDCGTF